MTLATHARYDTYNAYFMKKSKRGSLEESKQSYLNRKALNCTCVHELGYLWFVLPRITNLRGLSAALWCNELGLFHQGIAQVCNGISTKNCHHWLWELVGKFCGEFNESHFGLETVKQSLNCEVIEKSRHPYTAPWIILPLFNNPWFTRKLISVFIAYGAEGT